MGISMADDFDRARMQMQDELLHETRLSPAARLVGIELLRYVNRRHGYAWPGRDLVARQLAITVPTVRNSVKELERLGYFHVERNVEGRTSHYWPRFIERRGKIFFPPVVGGTGEKNASEEGRQRPAREEENRPLSPLRKSNRTPSREPTVEEQAALRRLTRLTEFRKIGDQEVERRVSKQLGIDGDDVLSVLYSIDGGAPYYQLIAAARVEPLDPRQLAAARAAYEAHGSSLPRLRAQGGRP
jgi:Helix-turn-helix domain